MSNERKWQYLENYINFLQYKQVNIFTKYRLHVMCDCNRSVRAPYTAEKKSIIFRNKLDENWVKLDEYYIQ